MSKVKLIVGSFNHLGEGRVIDLELKVPESERIIGVIRTDFDAESDGSVRSSDNLDPVVAYERINDLTGKLLTMVDATFTDKEQRQAMKDLFKQIAWNWYDAQRESLHGPWERDRNSK